jgi:hypothetical protein
VWTVGTVSQRDGGAGMPPRDNTIAKGSVIVFNARARATGGLGRPHAPACEYRASEADSRSLSPSSAGSAPLAPRRFLSSRSGLPPIGALSVAAVSQPARPGPRLGRG